MHKSAIGYGQKFFETYASRMGEGLVVDIGAQDVNGSLKDVCPPQLRYCGVDFVAAKGVDVVLTDPYHLPFDDGSVDMVVCSSCFEHSEFFWLLFLEILRILKPSGLAYINAPSNGYVHRYPIDAWRFYPDAGRALVSWGERNGYQPMLMESFIGNMAGRTEEGEGWNDFVAVVLKSKNMVGSYPERILEKHIDFRNGLLSDSTEFLNPSERSEDQLTLTEFRSRATIEADLAQERGKVVAEQASQIGFLNADKAKLEADLAQFRELLARRDSEVAALCATVSELREAVSAIHNSTSWRVTAPLRKVGATFKR